MTKSNIHEFVSVSYFICNAESVADPKVSCLAFFRQKVKKGYHQRWPFL